MKRTLISFAVLGTILGAAGAQAGGFDRSGQDTSIIFKEGNLLEITSVSVAPKVKGTYNVGGSAGNGLPDYSFNTVSFRTDINENMSFALIQDTPFAADVDWTTGTPGASFSGIKAKIESSATTALVSYDLENNITVYGGIKNQSLSASNSNPLVPSGAYSITSTADSSLGYVFGAAIEKPEIAMRVALTYHTKVSHEIAISETVASAVTNSLSTLSTETPEAFNFDFQTGIAENTLLFGTIRHVKWTQMVLAPPVYSTYTGGKTLKEFTSDTTNYSLGLGRKFTDQWSGAVTYGTESAEGVDGGPLGPTDGYKKLGLGVTYSAEKATVTLAVQKVNMGDTSAVAGPLSAAMTGGTALVTAVKIGYKF
jgi:long-chain fatty acid transport protein